MSSSIFIGAGTTVSGQISTPETVEVLGQLDGTISAKTLKIGNSGKVSGDVTVTDADIAGRLDKSIKVKGLLTVRSSGHIEGTISYGNLELEKGAKIIGKFESSVKPKP